MLSSQAVDALRVVLVDAGYTVDAVLERLGPSGSEGLARNATIPALHVLGAADDAQAVLIRLFPLQQTLLRGPVERVLGARLLRSLIDEGVLRESGRNNFV